MRGPDPSPEDATTLAVTSESESADATVQLTDREILEIFYHATDGPNWPFSMNWLTDAPLEHWYGVATDEQERVRVLTIAFLLSGSIPPELGKLAKLTRLNLGGFSGSFGLIPPELGNLSNLTSLSLRGLSGSIPPELGKLANLDYLRLSGSFGLIPPELGDLSNLDHLRLSGYTSPIPPEFGNLANLANLYLRPIDPSDPIPTAAIGDLDNLESLELRNFASPIPPEIGNFANLESLRLGGFSGPVPPEIGNLVNLTRLYLRKNHFSSPIPPEIAHLVNLQYLTLRENDLSGPIPAEWGEMSDLTYLDLTNNPKMSGPLPADITRIHQLRGLLAGGTDLCVPAEAGFHKWLKGIEASRINSCIEASPFAYLVQAVQSREFPVPLVAGRKAMLRVFPTAKQATDARIPGVEAHFFHEGRKVLVQYISGKPGAIPTEVDEGSLDGSVNAEITGDIIQPGLEMFIEIDPDGTLDPELFVAKRIPETGRLSVEVHDMPPFDLTLIPFVLTQTHDSARVALVRAIAADPENHETLGATRRLLPIGDIRVTAHEPVLTSITDARHLLGEVMAVRTLEWIEGGKNNRYYMGILPPGFTGDAAGVAITSSTVSVASTSPSTIAHELGHNLSLGHAQCGGPLSSGWYPYPDGSVGAWGYDFRDGTVVPPSHKELMSYCRPRWISDFNFKKALYHRPGTTIYAAAAATRSILLWGGVDAGGAPHLEPAFLVDAPPVLPDAGGEYRISGRAEADGTELFSFTFDMPEVADGDGGSSFAFTLPSQWEGGLGGITLSGPAGSFTLDRDTDMPMAILRDPRTGQVRGFLRDPPPATQAAADATGLVSRTTTGLDVLFSRGIPSGEAWR